MTVRNITRVIIVPVLLLLKRRSEDAATIWDIQDGAAGSTYVLILELPQ